MTFEVIERGAHQYNRRFGILFAVLRCVAMFFAVLAAGAILLNVYNVATIFVALAVGTLISAENIPYSKNIRDLLGRYITHLLIKASAQNKLRITNELKATEIHIRRLTQQLERLHRFRQLALRLSLEKALEKNKSITEECLSAISNEIRLRRVMQEELEGFEYEFNELVKKTARAIDTHLAIMPPSLTEKAGFARYINSLIENAKRL